MMRAVVSAVACMRLLGRPLIVMDIPLGIPVEADTRLLGVTPTAFLTTKPAEIRDGHRAALEQLFRRGRMSISRSVILRQLFSAHRAPDAEVVACWHWNLTRPRTTRSGLTPGITRRPASLLKHESRRVGGRVQAVVRRDAGNQTA